MYALVDCNNFFVSCERVFRPDLEGRPVMVLSGNDGCVIARSNEVKALGVPMGAPLFKMKDLVSEYNITCFSTNFPLYGDLSSRVMSLLASHTPRLQQYSIDEAFLDFDHIAPEQCRDYAEQIVRQIRRGIGIPVSIGIAPTKTLAKIASKYAKKYPGYHGVAIILNDDQRVKALSGFEIGDVWGIGRKARRKLEFNGIKTALDFARRDEAWIRNMFHKPGLQTWQELRGIDAIRLSDLPEKRSITVSRTFARGIYDRTVLEGEISNFLVSCSAKLRRQHSICRQIIVYAATSRFGTSDAHHYLSASLMLPVATNNAREMLSYTLYAFRRQYRTGMPYKNAGVILTAISPDNVLQRDMFDTVDRERDGRLQSALDNINNRYGRNSVRFGTQAADRDIYKLEHLSRRFTTNIDEIIEAKC